MIDFNKLNEMIDEVNTVIKNEEKETKTINEITYDIKQGKYNNVVEDLKKYCDVLTKANANNNGRIDIKIPFGNDKGFVFTRVDSRRDVWSQYSLYIYNNQSTYYIIDSRWGAKKYYYLNHSNTCIIWFNELIKDWDNAKTKIETEVVNGVNAILKSRAEKANEENKKAKIENQNA